MQEVGATVLLRSGEELETIIKRSEILGTCIDIMTGLVNPVIIPLKDGHAILRSEDILYIKIKCVQ